MPMPSTSWNRRSFFEPASTAGAAADPRSAPSPFQRPITQTQFPLEHLFEVSLEGDTAGLHPGFNPELTNQPYFVVRSA